MNDTTTIVNVEQRPTENGRCMWRITDADGMRYATRNSWLASLADQYRKSGTPVRMHSSAGWFYRDLSSITPAEQVGVA